MAPPPPNVDPDELRKRGRTNLTWILLTVMFLAVIAAPTMIVMFFGMLPTLVAYIIDRTKRKSASMSVGALNFIGVFPYLMTLWSDYSSIDIALDMVGDIFSLLVMYSAAAFGWLLFLALPSVISEFVIIIQQRKVAQLRGEQKDLIDEWGAEVAALVEMQKLAQKEHHMELGMEGMD